METMEDRPGFAAKPVLKTTSLPSAMLWDSTFFGFGVSSLHSNHHSLDHLTRAIDHSRDAGVTLLVYHAPFGTQMPESLFARHVDTRHVYTLSLGGLDLTQFKTPPDIIEPYEGRGTTDEFDQLGIQSGMYSRFFHDPVFPKSAAEALYVTWMRKSLSREIADLVLVARDGQGKVAAMFTNYTSPDGIIQPSLMAAFDHMRGLGLGRGFFLSGMIWAKAQGYTFGRIRTQGRNHFARKIYESLGCELEFKQEIFHIWLKDPVIKERYL